MDTAPVLGFGKKRHPSFWWILALLLCHLCGVIHMTIINIKMHLSFSIAMSEEYFKRKKKKLCILWLVITTNLFYSDIIKRKYMQNFPITKGSYYWWDLFHLVHVWRKFAFSCQPGVPKKPWEMPTKWQRTKEGWLLSFFFWRDWKVSFYPQPKGEL